MLENILATRPVQNWQDMEARMEWWSDVLETEPMFLLDWSAEFRKRIMKDHAILAALSSGVQSGHAPMHRTNAEKGNDVVELIKANPYMSARELARRAGVSPQTVLNWRKKQGV